MRRYLSQIPRQEAVSILINRFIKPDRTEVIPVTQAAGRRASSAVCSPETLPACRIASVDGIAVRSSQTRDARDRTPVEPDQYAKINTGQQVPDEYDAVIPYEETGESADGRIQVRKPARSGQNIRPAGADIKKGRLLLAAGHCLTAADIGALLTCGIMEIQVWSLHISLIPTGDEMVPGTSVPGPGQVRESNTAMIASLLEQAGISPIYHDIIPDNPEKIKGAILTALASSDMVIISAGSSAGTRDYTRKVIEEMGTVLFHGVAIRPGKSLLCGEIQGKAVIGLPGQPVASLTAFQEVVLELLRHWGFHPPRDPACTALAAEPISSDGGIDEYIPVSIFTLEGEVRILPRPRGQAGQIQGIRSNGILHIPARKEGYAQGSRVQVRIIRETDPGLSPVLLCGQGGFFPDMIEAACGDAMIPLVYRMMSPAGAAAALCKGTCHAILVPEHEIEEGGEVMTLIRSACIDPLIIFHAGSAPEGFCSRDEYSWDTISSIRSISHTPGVDLYRYIPQMPEYSPIKERIGKLDQIIVETEDDVIKQVISGKADAGVSSWMMAKLAGLSFLPGMPGRWCMIVRDKPEIRSELTHLTGFLKTDSWREKLPPFSADEAGTELLRISPAAKHT